MDARDPDSWPIRGSHEIVVRTSRVTEDGDPACYQAIIRAPEIAFTPFVGMSSSASSALQQALDEAAAASRKSVPPAAADDDLSFI